MTDRNNGCRSVFVIVIVVVVAIAVIVIVIVVVIVVVVAIGCCWWEFLLADKGWRSRLELLVGVLV